MRGHTLTMFEADVWKSIIDNTPEAHFKAFLKHHVLTSKFCPTPADAAAALGLQGGDVQVAYGQLERMVQKFGPYAVPDLSDSVLISAIHHLGGWAAVVESFPSPKETFLAKAFRERFEVAFKTAVSDVCILGRIPAPLLPIGGAASINLIPLHGKSNFALSHEAQPQRQSIGERP